MKILFLGDVVGISGCSKIMNNLKSEIEKKNIDFVILNGENSSEPGVGLNIETCKDFFNCGVDVITTGNHVWDQKEIMSYIEKENRLLRPFNLYEPSPGKGFEMGHCKINQMDGDTIFTYYEIPLGDSMNGTYKCLGGTGKYKGMLGAFECALVSNPKITFTISGMNDEIRKNYKKTHPLGTIVTFTYIGLTASGVPRHPND